MSGITPILDTLLHQVLGKRDGPFMRPPGEGPVRPAHSVPASSSVHSDSRLDPRALSGLADAAPARNRGAGMRAARVSDVAPATFAREAMLRLGPAARAIADVVARFPAAPGAWRAQGPLLTSDEPHDAALWAARLRDAIETSGLFYESHVQRWSRGEWPLRQLEREPQMTLTRSRPAATATTAAGRAGPGPATGVDVVVTSPPDESTPPSPSHPTTVVHPALEHLLRHQLEMLVHPPLRWEGEPWAGVLMALVLQPPVRERDQHREREQPRPQPGAAADDWCSRLTLKLPSLGDVAMDFRLSSRRIRLRVEARTQALPALRPGCEGVRERLRALGFDDVRLELAASASHGDAP